MKLTRSKNVYKTLAKQRRLHPRCFAPYNRYAFVRNRGVVRSREPEWEHPDAGWYTQSIIRWISESSVGEAYGDGASSGKGRLLNDGQDSVVGYGRCKGSSYDEGVVL